MSGNVKQGLASFTLPAGTVCNRNGIPFELAADTTVRCHPGNWSAIRDEFVPTVGGLPVMRGTTTDEAIDLLARRLGLSDKLTAAVTAAQPLTDDDLSEIVAAIAKGMVARGKKRPPMVLGLFALARAVEMAHGIGLRGSSQASTGDRA